jgi:putative hydrolase of HD superfamily
MEPKTLLEILAVGRNLKENTRHCWTTPERKESVADHSWRLTLMAFLLSDEEELKDIDMDKVVQMCLIHDLGEAFTGDNPSFQKTDADVAKEDARFDDWVASFPQPQKDHWQALLKEMNALATPEAKAYKCLDKMEALISHNESPLATWLPLEYDLQLSYGEENAQFDPYFQKLKKAIDEMTRRKIASGK